METVINTPSKLDGSSGVSLIIGILIALVLVVLFLVYGLPAIRNQNAQAYSVKINVNTPASPTPTPDSSALKNETSLSTSNPY